MLRGTMSRASIPAIPRSMARSPNRSAGSTRSAFPTTSRRACRLLLLLLLRSAASSLPDICQTVILTRTAVRASEMPKGEELATLGRSGATLAIHLSIANLARVVRELTPLYGADCPVAIAHRHGPTRPW